MSDEYKHDWLRKMTNYHIRFSRDINESKLMNEIGKDKIWQPIIDWLLDFANCIESTGLDPTDCTCELSAGRPIRFMRSHSGKLILGVGVPIMGVQWWRSWQKADWLTGNADVVEKFMREAK